MSLLSFKQGIHPDYNKNLTSDKPFKKAARPELVTILMQQHIGAPCKPLVKKGDHVDLGEKIGDVDSFVSAPIHASVSGIVKEIKKVLTTTGKQCDAVVIKADDEDKLAEGIKSPGSLDALTADDIRNIVKEAGIVGMGGAMFPTHVKLAIPDGKKAEYLILNGAECEPYLTVDHRMMLERPETVVYGMKALMKAIDVEKGIIAIEDNKQDALKIMKKSVLSEKRIEVKVMETKYPQGGEKMLIKALLDREVPLGGLPIDVGVVVNNISTAVVTADAITKGMPSVERSVTITGSGVKEPLNILCPIGISIEELIAEAGGLRDDAVKVILGGPMTGFAQSSLDCAVVKGTSGVVVLRKDEVDESAAQPCIRCARCVDVCPQFLLPVNLAKYAEHDMLEELEKYQVLNCIECGSCSYICPANRPLMQYIKLGKAEVMANKRNS